MSPNAVTSVSLAEHQHLTEMQENLQRKLMEAQKSDAGGMDSVRGSVLGAVVGENYERAKIELESYVASRTAYPGFQERAARYVQHCGELIQAIQTKREFPGLATLSLAKQQEIHEKVLEHFDELKQNLKQIEKVERENKLDDIRSTVWVLRTLSVVVALIFAAGVLADLEAGMFSSFFNVIDAAVGDASAWLVGLVGL